MVRRGDRIVLGFLHLYKQRTHKTFLGERHFIGLEAQNPLSFVMFFSPRTCPTAHIHCTRWGNTLHVPPIPPHSVFRLYLAKFLRGW